MLKRLTAILLYTSALLFIIAMFTPAQAMTNLERGLIVQFGINKCNSIQMKCQFKVIEDKIPQAFTTINNEIVITTSILDILTFNQMKSVILHEYGHFVYQHPKAMKKYFKTWEFDYDALKNVRHKQEIEADLYATHEAISNGFINHLPYALLKLHRYNPKKLSVEAVTHPSVLERIYHMHRYEAYYTKYNNMLDNFIKNERLQYETNNYSPHSRNL